MKPAMAILALGLGWAMGSCWLAGCSNSNSIGGTTVFYTLNLSVAPDTLTNNGNAGTVSCFVERSDGGVSPPGFLRFWTKSGSSESGITGGDISSTNSGTGTDPTVYYDANGVADTVDVIYAALSFSAAWADTLVLDSTLVHIE